PCAITLHRHSSALCWSLTTMVTSSCPVPSEPVRDESGFSCAVGVSESRQKAAVGAVAQSGRSDAALMQVCASSGVPGSGLLGSTPHGSSSAAPGGIEQANQ